MKLLQIIKYAFILLKCGVYHKIPNISINNNRENNQYNVFNNNTAPIPEYYNPFNYIEAMLIPLNNPENLNLRQNQEQIILLWMILNLLYQNNINTIYFRVILLLIVICFYSYLVYDFYSSNGFSLMVTRDLFMMSLILYIIIVVISYLNIYKEIKIKK